MVCDFLVSPNSTWLTRIIAKAFAAFLKQGSYQSELLAKIGEIERVSTRFKDISMSCLRREVVNTGKTVTSLATTHLTNHLLIKETIDKNSAQLNKEVERANQNLEQLRLNETRQHETTQQVLGGELKALKKRYEDQLELNQKSVDVLNSCKTLLESIYVALPLCFPSKETLQREVSKLTLNRFKIFAHSESRASKRLVKCPRRMQI